MILHTVDDVEASYWDGEISDEEIDAVAFKGLMLIGEGFLRSYGKEEWEVYWKTHGWHRSK